MGLIRYGVHQALDDAATELIRKSLEGVTSMEEKKDILTPWKEQDRRKREILSPTGVPDPSVRRGMFSRAWNPEHEHLNSRDGIKANRTASLQRHVRDDSSAPSGPLGQHLGMQGWDA